MADRCYHVIFNPNAGTALTTGLTTAALSEIFTSAGLMFAIDDDDDEPLEERIAHAIEGPADVIVAGGGDGTVLAVAEGLIASNKTLAILPLGTLNGLARDLELPLDVTSAIQRLPQLEPRAIDVGEVNGRAFLHNVIIGLVPGIGAGREKVRGTGIWGKIRFALFMIRRLSRARRIALALQLNESDDARPTMLMTSRWARAARSQSNRRSRRRSPLSQALIDLYQPQDRAELGREAF